MSRHKLVKNMDLDDELDDYDGGEDYDYDGAAGEEELSPEDQAQMIEGTKAVREALGTDVPNVTDREIQEALWHYYYDVGKSVTYILNSRMPKKENVPKKKKGGEPTIFSKYHWKSPLVAIAKATRCRASDLALDFDSDPASRVCQNSTVPKDFWNDMPWFNIPSERQTLFIEPLYPNIGLLGGSPDAAPKMSKLQALAAARKKKALEQKSTSNTVAVEKPMEKLNITGPSDKPESTGSALPPIQQATEAKENRRPYTGLKRKNSSPHRKQTQQVESGHTEVHPGFVEQTSSLETIPAMPAEVLTPSAFASTMFSNSHTVSPASQHAWFSLSYANFPPDSSTDAFSGPSPDDIVIAAQSKASSAKAPKQSSKATEKKTEQVTNGVESMKIDDTPRAKSKNLDVLAEFEKNKSKNAANFVVIGHVDAGKSTLMGRLLYDLKVVDQRTIDRYRSEAEKMGKASFALAWVLDQGTEERSRGVTIDIATNKFETEKTAFTILDAPGHRDFIPNMIAGASQADFAILVIDASTGSFESGLRGQTKEHALLVRSMGVQRLIVAINKLDTVNWSKDRFDEISQQVSAFLTAAGFQPKNISFIPLSGLHGDNIVSRSSEAAAAWYTGPTLVEELDNSEPVSGALDKAFRLTIGDIFRGGVQNPLSVSGRIETGSCQVGDAFLAQPSGQRCFVKGLEVDNEPTDWAVAGQNVTIHLSDIDPVHLKIGDVLCSPSNPVPCVRRLTIKVLAFEFLTPMGVDVHRGRLHAAGRIVELQALLDKGTGKVAKKRPKIVKPASIALVVVELDSAVPLEAGQRVVLRSNGETVAAGLLE